MLKNINVKDGMEVLAHREGDAEKRKQNASVGQLLRISTRTDNERTSREQRHLERTNKQNQEDGKAVGTERKIDIVVLSGSTKWVRRTDYVNSITPSGTDIVVFPQQKFRQPAR